MQTSFKKQNGNISTPPALLRCFHVSTSADAQVME